MIRKESKVETKSMIKYAHTKSFIQVSSLESHPSIHEFNLKSCFLFLRNPKSFDLSVSLWVCLRVRVKNRLSTLMN